MGKGTEEEDVKEEGDIGEEAVMVRHVGSSH